MVCFLPIFTRASLNDASIWRALQPPGYLKQWHAGVRVAKNKKLVGFISASPAHMKIYEKWVELNLSWGFSLENRVFYLRNVRMVEINFLCVHKKLRTKRLAPVLIKEITRRVNLQGIFQAVYTAGVILPSPVSKCRYFNSSSLFYSPNWRFYFKILA